MKKDDKKNKKKYDKEEVPLKHFGFNNLSELVKTVSNEDKNLKRMERVARGKL